MSQQPLSSDNDAALNQVESLEADPDSLQESVETFPPSQRPLPPHAHDPILSESSSNANESPINYLPSSSSLSIQASFPFQPQAYTKPPLLWRTPTDDPIQVNSSSTSSTEPPIGKQEANFQQAFQLSTLTTSSPVQGSDSDNAQHPTLAQSDGARLLEELHDMAEECSQPSSWQRPEQPACQHTQHHDNEATTSTESHTALRDVTSVVAQLASQHQFPDDSTHDQAQTDDLPKQTQSDSASSPSPTPTAPCEGPASRPDPPEPNVITPPTDHPDSPEQTTIIPPASHPAKVGAAESIDFFAGTDSIDFANVPLSPQAIRTVTSPPRPPAHSPQSKPLKRHFSRVSTNRSEFDLEDDDFWREAFGSENQHIPLATLPEPSQEDDQAFEPLSSSQLEEEAGVSGERDVSPALPRSPPPGAFLGFSTGANKRLAQPSGTAMLQAMKRFAETGSKDTPEMDIQRMAAAAALRRSKNQHQQAQSSSHPRPLSTPHAPQPLQDNDDSDDFRPTPLPDTIPTTVTFAKASGKALNLSKAAMAGARLKMDQWEAEDNSAQPSSRPPSTPMAPKATPLKAVPNATALDHTTSASPRPALAPLSASSARFNANTPAPAPASASASKRQLPPQSTPARQVSPTLRSCHSFVRPDQRNTRISLGMTPRTKPGPGSAGKPLFKTPFKASARASLATSPTGQSSPAILQSRKYPQRSPVSLFATESPMAATAAQPTVFDLERKGPRLGLQEYGMKPASERPRGASDLDPAPIQMLQEPRRCSRFVFGHGDETRSPRHALELMQQAGAHLVDEEWVKNHWSLILWKLAAYAVSKPEEAHRWFSFEETMRQLLYRYEREVNLAQRSAIKRIQEHDDSPALPMVLCVSGVFPEGGSEDGGRVPRGCALELTDGWYRIGAKVDSPLRRAIVKGKIRTGTKLHVQGCRLDSYGVSASGPLSAMSKVSVVLGANSTSMAAWDARLGFTRRPFVSALRSLSKDGGPVFCMEVQLTRVFPIGHVDVNDGAPEAMSGGEVRDEEAEAQAQRHWEARREDCESRLASKMESKLKQLDTLQDLLASHAADWVPETSLGSSSSQDMSHLGDYDLFAADLFEVLLTSERQSSVLSQELSKDKNGILLGKLLEVLSQRSDRIRADARAEVLEELNQLCPPRRVMSFRECRFVDCAAAAVLNNLRKPTKRTGQLKIRDIDHQPEGFIVQGGKYRVMNLVPVRLSSWRGADDEGDVFLTTRKDTKWTRVE